MASLGGAASGAATGAGIGSAIPVIGTGIGALAGGLIGLFKGGGSKSNNSDPSSVDSLSKLTLGNANSLNALGKDYTAKGNNAIDSVLSRLTRVLNGDRASAIEASGPTVNNVSDQYDAAYRAVNGGVPRGGGRNAALANTQYAKEGAITTALQEGQQRAESGLLNTGTSLAQLGASAQGASNQTLAQLLEGARQGHAESVKALEDLGLGLGQIIAMIASGSGGGSGASAGMFQ